METTDARHALLARLIDHAPMFPPASLAPAAALAEDARAAASEHAFMLARLVWPASALDEVATYERALSVVVDAEVADDPRIEAVETKPELDLVRRNGIPGAVAEVYAETTLGDGLEERLDQLAGRGFRAKVRCGGAAVPPAGELARFVRACRERGLVFKATAGLHHPVRGEREHGFLNLLAAAVFAGEEEDALAETAAGAFALDESSFRWRNRAASAAEVAGIRGKLFHSIGSCSFFEPVEELRDLGLLPS